MIHNKVRSGTRYNLFFGFDLIAEYSLISPEHLRISDLCTMEEPFEERRTAVVHNISLEGICLSFEDTHLDVGREIDLILTFSDSSLRKGSFSLACLGEIVWVAEDSSGFRAGLKFIEVPEDYPELFERIVHLLEKGRMVS